MLGHNTNCLRALGANPRNASNRTRGRSKQGLHKRWATLSVVLAVGAASAQEAIRYSLAGDAMAQQRRIETENIPYTFKTGDFRLLVTPSIGLEYNDNVNVVHSGGQEDEILRPMLQLQGSYPIGARNLLTLDLGIGYDQYFEHQNYSGLRVQSGSAVAFDIYVKDFRFDLHDRFSFIQDSAGYAAVYGIAKYGNFQNIAGLSVDWDLEDLVLTVGYDHLNYLIMTSQFDYINHASEMVVFRPGFRLNPTLTTGVEGTASFTSYEKPVLNDYVNYSAGVYADWRPSTALSIQPRAGYTLFDATQTSFFLLAQDQTTWYVDLTLRHAITKSITYSFSAGRELRPGIQTDIISDWYVRPNIQWNVIQRLSLNTSISYEHGRQGSQGFSGAASEVYDWFGGNINLAYSIFKKFTASAYYRYTIRGSDQRFRDYTQNLVGIQLSYMPR